METPMENTPTSLNSQVTNSRPQRKKSVVWEHFTIQMVGDNCRRACCNRCKQTFAYSSGSKSSGTSHLKRHLALGICPKMRIQDKKQKQSGDLSSDIKTEDGSIEPPKRRYRATSQPDSTFNQERSLSDLAKMIILHEYPLHMVDHPGFVIFVGNLQPQFRMETYDTIENECLAIYRREKCKIMQLLASSSGRVNLTVDLWTSSQATRYVSITGYFIDNEWKLHGRILNFMMVTSSNAESTLGDAIAICLLEWNLETKFFTITLDGYSSDNVMGANLRDHLANKNVYMVDSQLFLVRSFAHTLENVACEGLGAIQEAIDKVRESVKYVKASRVREEKFVAIALQNEISCDLKNLTLDIPSQWNTTYIMLAYALELKQVFSNLEMIDSNYEGAPTVDDWKKIDELCDYLKVLYEAACSLSLSYPATSNIYFHHACKIQFELKNAANTPDAEAGIIIPMQQKFDKYWKDNMVILANAVVMDPRFKMKIVEFNFSKIYGEDSGNCVKVISDGLHDLYQEYIPKPVSLTPAFCDQGSTPSEPPTVLQSATNNYTADGLHDFDVYISETSINNQTKSELDQYLEESLMPRIQEFDLLNWWKLNELKYPTLSMMARDILSITISSVPLESIFMTESKVLDQYRSSLPPVTLEALVCAKDWLQHESFEVSNGILRLEY